MDGRVMKTDTTHAILVAISFAAMQRGLGSTLIHNDSAWSREIQDKNGRCITFDRDTKIGAYDEWVEAGGEES